MTTSRRLRIAAGIALVATLCAGPLPARAADPGRAVTAEVTETEVCFTVDNPGDPVPATVVGTLFHTASYGPDATALLLLHGAVAERGSWDGGRPFVRGAPSVARRLAEAGYGVFAIDRLGYGESPYGPNRSGWLLTAGGQVEITHQIVTQLREGTFVVADATCAAGSTTPHGVEHVVLSGFSGGGLLTMGYATRYHDVDGIIPMGFSTAGGSAAGQELLVDVLAPQFAQGKDYVELFIDGAHGYSKLCERLLFYEPGVRQGVLEQFCGTAYYAQTRWPSPSGEIAGGFGLTFEIRAARGNVGPTPVLLVFGDNDPLVPGPNARGSDPDLVTAEIEAWRNECNCDVTAYIQPGAAHVNVVHQSVPQLVAAMVDWLQDHDL